MVRQSGKTFVAYAVGLSLVLVAIAAVMADDRNTAMAPTSVTVINKPKARPGFRPLRVMTFNVAHGSKNMFGVVPLFRGAGTIKKRLRDMAAFLGKHNPDVVALQEADGPSWWSGKFHHVNYLAMYAGYPYAVLGIHVKTSRKRYGTGLISRLPMSNVISHRFKPIGMFKKGFVIATFAWPGKPKVKVDVLSLHLDPRNKKIQTSQLREVVQMIKSRKRPVIVTGDFNTVYFGKNSALKILTEDAGLTTHKKYDPYLYTHRFPSKRRIDWIFLSKELSFVNHKIIKVKLTDHFPVMADIRYNTPRPKARPKPRVRPKARPRQVLVAKRAVPARRVAPRQRPKAPAVKQAGTRPASSQPTSRPSSQPTSRPVAR